MFHLPIGNRRSRSMGFLLCLLTTLPLVLGACSKAPPPPNSNPIDDRSSALGLHMELGAFLGSVKPEVVVFARVDDGVPLTETFEVYSSTYAHDGNVYLMNVEPGTYVAVAAFYDTENTFHENPGDPDSKLVTKTTVNHSYFSRSLIEQTRVTVEPNSFAFMGRIAGNQSKTFGDGDDCQVHFKEMVEGQVSSWEGFNKLMGGEFARRVDPREIDAGAQAKREFLVKSKEYFATTGWMGLIDVELAKVH